VLAHARQKGKAAILRGAGTSQASSRLTAKGRHCSTT
jgi:hypothetical protein